MSEPKSLEFDYSKYDFKEDVEYKYISPKGLDEEVIRELSQQKGEPEWMLKFRLEAYRTFLELPMPNWGPDLSAIDFDEITYYLKASDKTAKSWDDVPEKIKETFEKLGIPEAERKFLAGVGAQFESEVVYHSLREDLEKKGVIFLDTDTALKEHPELFRKYFATVVPPEDNKFAALNSAVWSGGSFIYVPPGVHVDIPLQAYFRINAKNVGQFERTLIIVDKGASVHYIEGCTAPVYSTHSLHAAVVEIIAMEGAKIRYTTVQNWSKDVYNLVTKRAHAYAHATVEWVDANIGSGVTMKYPSVYLMGPYAKADVLSVAYANTGQHQDTGSKAVHLAPHTSSRIDSRSISVGNGRTTYRGLIYVAKGAVGCKSSVRCDALLLGEHSKTDTYPYMEILEEDAVITHEATVGKIGEEQLFYLMSRGLSETDALNMIVMGFFEPFTKELPMDYAIEFNRLLQLDMSGAIG